MYIVKITFILPLKGNNTKNANINPREIANFRKCAKCFTRENIYTFTVSYFGCVVALLLIVLCHAENIITIEISH